MIDPLYIIFFIFLIAIMIAFVPKAMRSKISDADSLLANALVKKQTGSMTEAEYFLQQALAAYEKEKTPDLGKMWSCYVHLAELQTKLGKYADARALYSRLIESWNDEIHKDNPEAYLDIDYLASTAEFGAGTHEVAECYARIIDAKRRVFGNNHPDVANSLKIYARLLHRLGRNEDAVAAEEEAESVQALPAPKAPSID
ncbi:MAG TPA: tetratricopeptide repeat protein [Drouetiella sp.]